MFWDETFLLFDSIKNNLLNEIFGKGKKLTELVNTWDIKP